MKRIRNPAQISMTEERIVDSFSGGGGASSGIELATGRVVDVAINHDKDAILMHSVNHPFTKHLQASVWDVEPEDAVDGAPVGLLWASPDCKHFSKARVKIGKLNYHPSDIDWAFFGREAERICKMLGYDYYIKDSLRAEMEAANG